MQMSQKKGKAEEEFYKNQENAYKTKGKWNINKAILENEQQDFLNYAESWIKEYHSAGKDIKPLMLELKEQKKKSVFG